VRGGFNGNRPDEIWKKKREKIKGIEIDEGGRDRP